MDEAARHAASTREDVDLMRLRGGLGIAGQALMIASGVRRGEKLKVWSAGVSTVANVINLVYGVQKKEDGEHLAEAKQQVDTLLGLPHPAPEQPAPATLAEKADRTMQHHSVRISDGIKLGGKYLFRLAGMEAGNAANTWHGNLSIAAKVMTLVGKDEDPYTSPADKSMIARLREQSNMISGGMELMAQYPLFPGALNRMNKRTGQIEHDWLQLGAATLFTGALVAKCLSPFTVEKINREELFDYAADRLRDVPKDTQEASLAEVSTYLHEVLAREALVRKMPKELAISQENIAEELHRRLQPTPTLEYPAIQYEGRLDTAPLMAQAR